MHCSFTTLNWLPEMFPRVSRFLRQKSLTVAETITSEKQNEIILQVKESLDFETFMKIEEETLVERHAVKPVHTAEEMKLLAGRFPANIKLFGSFKDDVMLAGIIMYESKNVAHMQYAANSKEGWKYRCSRYNRRLPDQSNTIRINGTLILVSLLKNVGKS